MMEPRDVVVWQDGADKGKVFRITPMSAWRAEKWGWKAMGALARSGVDLPPAELLSSMAVIASLGLEALMKAGFHDVEPLLDEIMGCVAIVPDPSNAPNITRTDIEHDVALPGTILWLRDQVLETHTGFSVAAILSNFREVVAAQSGNLVQDPTSPPNISE